MTEDFGKLLKQFYVKLPGGKKTITVGAEVPVEIHRWMDELAASKDYPEYKTRSDVLRDCMYVGMQLRTDARFREVEELTGMRAGINALDTYSKIEAARQLVDELVFNLQSVDPKSKRGASLLADSQKYLLQVDDEKDRIRLSQAVESFNFRKSLQ